MAGLHPDPATVPGRPRRRHSTSRPAAMFSSDDPPRRTANAMPSLSIDPDTCRICRGEATVDEPLFYPCKCSGSIKYVHQDCLMEWLSHSQKKHCELCKTPFRFTKLYNPKMPAHLPIHIFLTHLAKYLLRNLVVWLRAGLVACVWLCWLPYLMRRVWTLLFWISDEGLGGILLGRPSSANPRFSGETALGDLVNATAAVASSVVANTSSTILANLTNPAAGDAVVANGTSLSETLFYMLLKVLLPVSPPADVVPGATSTGPASGTFNTHSTWLSDVDFLRSLTRYPSINQAVITVLEGQLITILVIVCFILVILVRDYVVQQQPEINMRAAFAAQAEAPAPRELFAGVDPRIVEGLRGPDPLNLQDVAGLAQDPPLGGTDGPVREREDEAPHFGPADRGSPMAWTNEFGRDLDGSHRIYGSSGDSSSGDALRDRDPPLHSIPSTSGSDGETSGSGSESSPPSVGEFTRIYRRADGDPETILQIVADENLEEKLDYWVRNMRAKLEEQRLATLESEGSSQGANVNVTSSSASYEYRANGSEGPSLAPAPYDDDLNASTSTLPLVATPGEPVGKGKGKQVYTPGDESWGNSGERRWPPSDVRFNTNSVEAAPGRSRAATDGPDIRIHANPLANNSWAFPGFDSDAAGSWKTMGNEEDQISTQSTDLQVETSSTIDDESVADDSTEARTPSRQGSSLLDGDGRVEEEAGRAVPIEHTAPHRRPPTPPAHDAPAAERRGLTDRVADFMWGDVDQRAAAAAAAAPAGDVDPNELPDDDGDDDFETEDEDEEEEEFGANPEAGGAAAGAGLDPEVIDDMEDFEGIMELIGMRGPLAGLFQNAVFCACLVFMAIFLCIFLPYNLGRISVWVVANPMRLVRMMFALAKLIQDITAVVMGTLSTATLGLLYSCSKVFGRSPSSIYDGLIYSWRISINAATRIVDGLVSDAPIHASEVQNFSAVSHDALLSLKTYVSVSWNATIQLILFFTGSSPADIASQSFSASREAFHFIWGALSATPAILLDPSKWVIDLQEPATAMEVDASLAFWPSLDRFWAILSGYISLAVLAALYIQRGSPFSTGQTGQEWEASIVDVLNQASGVTKVILIIGIEMLVFPLYCGLLMDAALLPLFTDATIKSRFEFTMANPMTSIFVHWFVGTGYMFHFALFVSMCRKIMRPGVLYFIRDPDDPDFHPVRDVLERHFTTQLRKILFSALVYGGLVVVCLGGVVWGLSMASSDILPIHYSSNEPVLEFPIDLLFYNFFMPLAVKVLKPSDGLHAMYTWWFRRCARGLRLTWFLFGERRIDEEGILQLPADSPHTKLPSWRRTFLELDVNDRVVPRTWGDVFEGGTAKPIDKISPEAMDVLNERKSKLVKSKQLVEDGRLVRAPSSDQVRIPKGRRVFLDMTENDNRPEVLQGAPEDIFSPFQYQPVYIPPNFRVRVFGFILSIWIFAAVTGVGFTIIPLLAGRRIFQALLPHHVRTNDIYAFTIGIYLMISIGYIMFHSMTIFRKVRAWSSIMARSLYDRQAAVRIRDITISSAKFLYAYAMLLVLFPLLTTALMELYFIIPLHTYMYPPTSTVGNASNTSLPLAASPSEAINGTVPSFPQHPTHSTNTHTIQVVQAWTLGLLYVKLGSRLLTSMYEGTRLAGAVRAVMHRGWMRPDIAILTKAFVIPALVITTLAILVPTFIVQPILSHFFTTSITLPTPHPPLQNTHPLLYRISFPLALALVLLAATTWSFIGVFNGWKARIRDEAYLMGERLHNFGAGAAGAGVEGFRALRGGARL